MAEAFTVHTFTGVLGDLESQDRPFTESIGQSGTRTHGPHPVHRGTLQPRPCVLRRPLQVGAGV